MDNITYLGIFFLALLLLPTFYINQKLQIHLTQTTVISVIRMAIQLSLIGIYLKFIFDTNSILLNIAYLFISMSVAALSVCSSSGLKRTKVFVPVFVVVIIVNFVMILFFNFVVIRLTNIFAAQYFISISGMLLGNTLNGDIIGLKAFYSSIQENKDIFNYDLTLGATRIEALKPYLTDAMTKSLQPTLANMATMGIVSLPGMVTGQILGGSIPMRAIMYQIAIMIAIYIVRYFNLLLVLLFTIHHMFNDNDMIIADNFIKK